LSWLGDKGLNLSWLGDKVPNLFLAY